MVDTEVGMHCCCLGKVVKEDLVVNVMFEQRPQGIE